MLSSLDYVRQHIKEMPAYEPILPLDVLSDELGIPIPELIKLDANESPFGPIPEVNAALASLDTLHIYPDPENRRIRKILSSYHQIPEKNIFIGAGADELIDLIMRIILEPGEGIINCPPTFGMYAFDGVLNKAEIIPEPRQPDFSININGIKKAVEKYKPKLMFLANPNNPDGGMISEDEFKELVDLPLILVIDEAYIHFSDQSPSLINKVEAYPNLIILRTFSKWAGLAGLRIGYGIFPSELVPILMKAKQPYNVSVAAEQAALITMNNIPLINQYTDRIIVGRNRLFKEMSQFTWLEPYPSQANFILCKVKGIPAVKVKRILRERGILIRHFDSLGLNDHIRISVGKEDEINKVIAALKGIR